MANKTTFIKLDRNILEWRWYKDQNTKALFIHLLLKANIKPHGFREITIQRGELATSYATLAAETGLSIRNIRTALEHLQQTGEVTVKRHARFTVISIPQYDLYQSQVTGNRQASDSQVTGNRQQSKNERRKEGKKPPKGGQWAPPTVGDVSAFCLENGLQVDAQRFVDYYEAVGWTVGGQPVRSWEALCRRWNGSENYSDRKPQTMDEKMAEAMRLLDEGGLYDTAGSQ